MVFNLPLESTPKFSSHFNNCVLPPINPLTSLTSLYLLFVGNLYSLVWSPPSVIKVLLFDTEIIEVNEGEMIVVPKGVDHKPTSEDECQVMLVEPKGVLNTGNIKGELTAPNDEWI